MGGTRVMALGWTFTNSFPTHARNHSDYHRGLRSAVRMDVGPNDETVLLAPDNQDPVKFYYEILEGGQGQNIPIVSPHKYHKYFVDFDSLNDFSVDETGTVTDWLFTVEQEAVSLGAQDLITDTQFGVIRLTNDVGDDDAVSLQRTGAAGAGEVIALTADKTIYFETRLSVSHATDQEWWAGLSTSDTGIADVAQLILSADYIGVGSDDDSADFHFSAAKNGPGTGADRSARAGTTTNETIGDGVLTVADTMVRIGIKIVGTTEAHCYLNGVFKSTITTNLPDDVNLCFTFALVNGSAAARTMDIDYILCLQER